MAEIFIWVLGIAVVAIVAAPVIVYQCVKFGMYAALRGRQVFIDQEKRKHGDQKSKAEEA